MGRRLLALDQSSRATGYGIFVDGAIKAYGCIDLMPQDLGERLVLLRQEITRLINKYEINEIAFEDIQMQNGNVVTYKALAEVFGIILMLTTELQIDYSIVPSAT